MQENEKAPTPRNKKIRELKYNIEPLDYKKYISSLEEFVQIYGEENKELFF